MVTQETDEMKTPIPEPANGLRQPALPVRFTLKSYMLLVGAIGATVGLISQLMVTPAQLEISELKAQIAVNKADDAIERSLSQHVERSNKLFAQQHVATALLQEQSKATVELIETVRKSVDAIADDRGSRRARLPAKLKMKLDRLLKDD